MTMALLSYLKAGDHFLIADSVYGPARRFCETFGKDFRIESTYYDLEIDETGITALIQPNTKVIFAEKTGSHKMEVRMFRCWRASLMASVKAF